MRHTRTSRLTFAMTGAALLALSATAHGQTTPGDGHALDANLHANQGRINPRVSGIEQQLRYNNAVINGSAPNGQSFRGSLGYRATDQFGGSVGSDTLYNFKRDSFTSGLAAGGVRGSDALRYQFSLSTGQHVPGFMAAPMSSVARSGSVSTNSVGATGSALRSTSDFVTSQSYRPTLVGVKQDELGAEYVARASPLLGVAWVKTAESPLGARPNVPVIPGIPGITPAPGPDGTPGVTPAGVKPETRPLVNPFTGLETSARGVGSVMDRQSSALDLQIRGAQNQAGTAVHNQLVTRFREGFDQPGAPKPVTPDGAPREPVTFEAQMDRLHRMLSGKPEPKADEQVPQRAPDGTLNPKPMPPKPGDKPRSADPNAPASPDGKTPAPSGAKPVPADPNKLASTVLDALTPEFMRGLKKVQEKKVDHYVEPAPAIGPDTSVDPEGYRQLMREGEQLLAQSRFFDAEDHFVRAIAGAPRDPMARAARLHAQLGAGLYLSAAANLRALLAMHPEVASTRYADALLPTPDRCKVIVEQLVEQERKYDSALGRESALLAAYIGYQRSDAKRVTEGLAAFEKRMPPGDEGRADRMVLELVRAAWTIK